MLRTKICILLILLTIGCTLRPGAQKAGTPETRPAVQKPQPAAATVNPQTPSERKPAAAEPVVKAVPVTPEKNQAVKQDQQPVMAKNLPVRETPAPAPQNAPAAPEPKVLPAGAPEKKAPPVVKNKNAAKSHAKPNAVKPPLQEERNEPLEEADRDVMEEALVLLNESHNQWVKGDLEGALVMLDQAYALLLDINGNPDIARQKDDLRLMISRRILTLYNSTQGNAKGIACEIPFVINADVEKEIRQFQTVEREFFISSYQRSFLYRPMILRELKKAGFPEELSWLPLVESGFKISALSPARALGLWQFIPSTGYKYGLTRDDWADERMDMEKSTRAAIDYMKDLHGMFGDWLTVLAAYNCGEGRIIRTIASQHINYLDRFWDLYHKLPYETARYVPRFIATVLIIRDPQRYGMDLGNGKVPELSYETVEINKSMRLPDIARRLEIPEETLNILNAELRHKMTPDRPYQLRVPVEMKAQLLQVIDEIPMVDAREAQRKKRSVTIKHKVRQGETIDFIAQKYKTSASAIRAANSLKGGRLAVGQRLTVPIQGYASAPATGSKSEKVLKHKVKKGDTLVSLAKQYGVSGADIRKANQLESEKLIIGQTLRIEKGKAEAPRETQKEDRADGKGKVKAAAHSGSDTAKEAPAGKTYTVKKGDSLSRIADENNTTLEKLRQLNKLSSDLIYPGQVMQVR
jgi:membrane-bound lytic murein transglycosylase D